MADGVACSETTVLVGYDGAIQMCVNSDWPLDSLARERGARAAYRVTTQDGEPRVETLLAGGDRLRRQEPEVGRRAGLDVLRACLGQHAGVFAARRTFWVIDRLR